MVIESNPIRFSSKRQAILEVLDPIHRSLLLNNSAYEHVDDTTKLMNLHSTNSIGPATAKTTTTQAVDYTTHKVTEPQQQPQVNLIENKHYFDVSYSSAKPDATYVTDINGAMVFDDENISTNDSERSSPTEINKNFHKMKNIRIRILTNKKRRISDEPLPKEKLSSAKSTDTSSYEYVETDSEIESSESTEQENNVDSASSRSDHKFSDRHDSNNSDSSCYEDASTTSSTSNAPMIHIIQEITERRLVTSTIHVNREKARSYSHRRQSKVSPKEKKTKWKNTQKIIDDNVCNEILDQSINWDEMGDNEVNDVDSSPSSDFMWSGELKAKPKYSERTIGKLMEKRLSRIFDQGDHILQQTLPPNYTFLNSIEKPHSPTTKPPAKPPRTFTSVSSKESSDSVDTNSAATLAIEDIHKSSKTSILPQISPGGGWVFDRTTKVKSKPTCPTFEEINDVGNVKKIGWAATPKRDECLDVLNMLNYDNRMQGKITSSNLFPEPQSNIQYKEDIDQVDSSHSSHRPIPPARKSKQLDLSMDLDNTMCSTPIKRSNRGSNKFLSSSAPSTGNIDMEMCKKCKLQVMKPSSVRKSFGKGAIKRTKSFFKASKNIWTRPKSTKVNKSCENQYDLDSDCHFDDDETPTKMKSNTTAEFNSDNTPKYEKKFSKTLELTPTHSTDNNVIESPRRIFDKFLTSVKRTPPKKPIRQSLLNKATTRSPSNNEDEGFNFNRVIESPKSKQNTSQIIKKGLKLSPRKLFRSSNEKAAETKQANSYRSFETGSKSDLKMCISEYLREMNEKIDCTRDSERCQTLPRCRTRNRNLSTSSDAIDYMPQRVVEIDCHPEPIYSEIIPQRSIEPNHIIVNNNPRAIYATIDKSKKGRSFEPMSIPEKENDGVNQEYLSRSCNSLPQSSMDTCLADSILNMLELLKQQRDDCGEITEDTQVITTGDDFDLECVGSKVKNCQISEEPTIGWTSEYLQQSVPKCNEMISDNTSIETYFTENICDDVIRGDSVNNNIVTMIDQLENMDLISTINLVEPETDDGSVFEKNSPGNEDHEMDFDYSSYAEVNTTKASASNTIIFNNFHINRAQNESSLKKIQSPLQSVPSMIEIPDQYMLKLTNQISFQREIRNQLKHAIEICRTTKEFECSNELVEAERLMLLSARKELCAKNELNRIDYEENGLTRNPEKCQSSMTIKNIEFAVKSEEMFDSFFNLFFVCMCSYRDQVVATFAQERDGDKVVFNDLALNLSNLDSTFEVTIEVFVLRLRKPFRKYSHESKYHLNKESKKSVFINPAKLFSNSSTLAMSSNDFDESRFRVRAFSTITTRMLSSEKFEIIRNDSWPQNHAYRSYNTKTLDFTIKDQFANMTGPLCIELICEICLRDSGLEGFIEVANEKENSKLYWCRLTGCTLEFWNDDVECRTVKRSILSIDLRKCTNETIQLADKVFSLDIFNDEFAGDAKNRINRYWISANNRNDLILWLTELNRILKFIKDWNV